MEIIGIIGNEGVGKNYIAEKVLPEILPIKNTVVLAFADHFKVDAITKYGADINKVYGKKDYDTRKMLQETGTENGRNKYGKDIWIRTIETWINVLYSRGTQRFIICDVRFQNEAEFIKKMNGTLIKVEAHERHIARLNQESNQDDKQMNSIQQHESEKGINTIKNYDILVFNNPADNVTEQLKKHLL